MFDVFIRQHLAHVRASRRISDRTRTAANEADGTMAGTLHMSHGHQGDEMTGMQAVRRRIEADVEGHALFVKEFAQLGFIRTLGDEASFFQGIKYVCQQSLSFISGSRLPGLACHNRMTRKENPSNLAFRDAAAGFRCGSGWSRSSATS